VQPQQRKTPDATPTRSVAGRDSVDLGGAELANLHLDRDRRAALEDGDEVVQQLCIAKYALAAGDTERAMSAVDTALALSRHSLSGLLGSVNPPDAASHAGALVRSMAAGSSNSDRPAPVAPQRHGRL
jgi:hypothetical protein